MKRIPTLLGALVMALCTASPGFAQDSVPGPSKDPVTIVGKAPDQVAYKGLGGALQVLEDSSDLKFRLVVIAEGSTGGTKLQDFADQTWERWTQDKDSAFKDEGVLFFLNIKPRRLLVRQGSSARAQGIQHSFINPIRRDKFDNESGAPHEAFLTFIKAFSFQFQRRRADLEMFKGQLMANRNGRRILLKQQLRDLGKKIAELDRVLVEHHENGERFDSRDLLSRAQQLWEKAHTLGQVRARNAEEFSKITDVETLAKKLDTVDLGYDYGAALNYCNEAEDLLSKLEKQVRAWRDAKVFLSIQGGEIKKLLQKMKRLVDANNKAFLAREAKLITESEARWDSDLSQRTNPIAKQVYLSNLKKKLLRIQKDMEARAKSKTPTNKTAETKETSSVNSWGGFLFIFVFVCGLGYVALFLTPGKSNAERRVELQAGVAELTERLSDIHKRVLNAQNVLREGMKPKTLQVDPRLARFLGKEVPETKDGDDSDGKDAPLVELEAAPLYRGVTDRAFKRARLAVKDMGLVYSTTAAIIDDSQRLAEANEWRLAEQRLACAERGRDVEPLSLRIKAVIGDVDQACQRLIKELPDMLDQIEALETRIDKIVESGLAPGHLTDRFKDLHDNVRDAAFSLNTDPMRGSQHLDRVIEERKKLSSHLDRIESSLELYKRLQDQVNEIIGAGPIPSPFHREQSLGLAQEQLRMVGSAMNNGQIDYALQLLDRAEEQLENRDRVEKVKCEAEESFDAELKARESETKAIQERLDQGRESLEALKKDFAESSFQDVKNFVTLAENWSEHFNAMITDAKECKEEGKTLEARLLLYYLAEKQADIGSLLDQITAKRFEVTSERDRALSLKTRLAEQETRLSDYFEREKASIRAYSKRLLEEASKAFAEINSAEDENEGNTNWPQLAAEYHECAQLFDLARNAAEHDVQHVRKAWQLQESVSDVLQKLDGDCENKEFKDLAEIYFKSLEARFESVRQSFSDESARWEVVIDSLQHLLRHTRFLLYPPNSLTTQHIYAQSCIDYAKNAIRRSQMETPEPGDEFETATKGLKTAQDEVDNGHYSRALELVCQAENEIEQVRRQALLKTLKEKEERKTQLFTLIRAHQRVREKHSTNQNQRNVKRKETWLGSSPEEIASVWSRQTFWARGLTLGLLDPLPVTTAAMFTNLSPDVDLKLGDDMLDTRKIAGSHAAGPVEADAGGEDPFAKFAAAPAPGGDPFAAFAGGAKDDPFAAFAGGDPMAPLPAKDEEDDTPTPDPDAAFGMSPGPAPEKAEDSDITEVVAPPANLLNSGKAADDSSSDDQDDNKDEGKGSEDAEEPEKGEEASEGKDETAEASDSKSEDEDQKPELKSEEDKEDSKEEPKAEAKDDKEETESSEASSDNDADASKTDPEPEKADGDAEESAKAEDKGAGDPSMNGQGEDKSAVKDESGEAQKSETSKKS